MACHYPAVDLPDFPIEVGKHYQRVDHYAYSKTTITIRVVFTNSQGWVIAKGARGSYRMTTSELRRDWHPASMAFVKQEGSFS